MRMRPSSLKQALGQSLRANYPWHKRLFSAGLVKFIFVVVVVINLFFIISFTFDVQKIKKQKSYLLNIKLPNLSSEEEEVKETGSDTFDVKNASSHNGAVKGGAFSSYEGKPAIIEVANDDIKFPFNKNNFIANKYNNFPKDTPYASLNASERIMYNLYQVSQDKEKYWLGHTELTDYEIKVHIKDFLYENWIGKPVLFYDPRFTLSIYLSEIRHQFLRKNRQNSTHQQTGVISEEVVVPFAWSDWVDLTMLNEELIKPESQRKNCEYMKATHHIPTKYPDYCINNIDIGKQDIIEMKLPSTNHVPGFAVRRSPTNKASNEVRMLEGKSHLLTYASNPLTIIFLTDDENGGVYEVKVDSKQRIVDGELFDNYLRDNNIDRDEAGTITLNPVKEFDLLAKQVQPSFLNLEEDDIYGMVANTKQQQQQQQQQWSDPTKSREVHLPLSVFDYQQDDIDTQIKHFETRLKKLHDLTTNELTFNLEMINEIRLSRKEKLYYDGLKYANKYSLKKEPTHFRMARLNFGNKENDHDAGWHYEWRFFNGGLKYVKKGWNEEELQIREKVLLDRILRNWFKFANAKGILSWIAHGPLLSWYWNGLLFPFDEDIDIQMPATELARLSRLYNQTLVVENINEGFGKYMIECSSFIHHRGKSYKENHIDARFIDIDTGSYIDITGLGVSDEPVPERYSELIRKNELEGKQRQIYNCRFPHFYSHEEISPLRYTMLQGVPVYIPNKVETILKQEYSKGLTNYEFEGFFFVDALNLWIHYSKLEFLFPDESLYNYNKVLNVEKFTELINGLSEEKIVELLEKDKDILLEYYLTKDVTDLHKKELFLLFNAVNDTSCLIRDIVNMKTSLEISSNEEYHRLTSQFQFRPPLRKALFNYEAIEQPRHH
ncbi:hypothetical protein KGF56_003281 [Candida oxycetoniae]|uniref:LicD/FKTN/FKRP nucleotidyltransferase domain-containing protein n=1 Tax=Candida oxycetoniae TaxID=497107 RepID=A0AAI9WX21_9ASCO|nr:uncharacterized protein KGF56_003281 [Candida oxycetoniae]KAI3403851.2 hypothetical protein KGF56_003281 [Candida oxycetoniae]